MLNRSYIHSRSGSRDGIALVMVLAFIVLLTIMVVSFVSFARINRVATASYSKSVQAQEIAEGGVQDVLNDLHLEIMAGSVILTNNPVTGNPYTNSLAVVYVPISYATAQPARLGYPTAAFTNDVAQAAGTAAHPTYIPQTVVRVSRADPNQSDTAGTNLYPALNTAYYTNMAATPLGAILNRASAASTTNSSINGRTIAIARWNKPYLLAMCSAWVPWVFTTNAPDWVYVTRTGSRVCTNSEIFATYPNNLLPSNSVTNNYGTNAASGNPPASPVVGRYAYVVYDEGALLDINVAGFISSSTNKLSYYTNSTLNPGGVPQAVYGKSYLSHADLTELPGVQVNIVTGLGNYAQIDQFIAWRNASTATTAGGFPGGTNYLNAAFSEAQSGFLSFQSNATTGVSDNPLLGRQDLINYFAKVDSTFNNSTNLGSSSPAEMLPYLGTFSRALNWPSWAPSADSQNLTNYLATNITASTSPTTNVGNVPYRTNMELTGSTNRDIPNVRFLNAGTVTHYSDNATNSVTYGVSVGDPLVQHRFSLAKIAWLSQVLPNASAAPPAPFAAAIQACFGLVWGKDYNTSAVDSTGNASGNPCWIYVGSQLSAPGVFSATSSATTAAATGIETLGQVAAEAVPREPNFFEMLKAGILSGSVGRDPGPWGGTAAPNQSPPGNPLNSGGEGVQGVYFDTLSADADLHLLQIGANIIDQFDADSYPTPIYLRKFPAMEYTNPATATNYAIGPPYTTKIAAGASPAPEMGPVDLVYGIENLPYLMRVYSIVWHTSSAGGDTGSDGLNCWLQPELWSPFQAPPYPLAQRPATFMLRARAYGSVFSSWNQTGFYYPYPSSTNVPPYQPPYYSHGSFNCSTTNSYNGQTTNSLIYFIDPYGTNFSNHPVRLNITNATSLVTIATTPTANQYPYGTAGTATYPTGLLPINKFGGFHAGWTKFIPATTNMPTSPATNSGYVYDRNGDDVYYTSGQQQYSWGTNYNNFGQQTGLYTNGAYDIYTITGATYPSPLLTFALQYSMDSGATWLPYNYMSRIGSPLNWQFTPSNNTYANGGVTPSPPAGYPWGPITTTDTIHNVPDSGYTTNGVGRDEYCRPDPTTDRLSSYQNQQPGVTGGGGGPYGDTPLVGFTFEHGANTNSLAANAAGNGSNTNDPTGTAVSCGLPWRGNGFFYDSLDTGVANGYNWEQFNIYNYNSTYLYPGSWEQNFPQVSVSTPYPGTNDSYYVDPDGVNRPGDGYLRFLTTTIPTTGDGGAQLPGAYTTNDINNDPTGPNTPLVGRRPLILNRPFLSVGELGYVKRDLPFKTLDFFSPFSGDAALLDLFSITDEPKISAGQVNFYNAPPEVLAAVVEGTGKEVLDSNYIATNLEPLNVGQDIQSTLNPQGTNSIPLLNRADLVTRLGGGQYSIAAGMKTTGYPADNVDKAYVESVVRALSDVSNTRTWNLFIDIIAQSGQMSPTAQTLNDFVVQGEKRYWVHIAIDRYTGKIIDSQVEPVYQ